jgi:hypothetical protein
LGRVAISESWLDMDSSGDPSVQLKESEKRILQTLLISNYTVLDDLASGNILLGMGQQQPKTDLSAAGVARKLKEQRRSLPLVPSPRMFGPAVSLGIQLPATPAPAPFGSGSPTPTVKPACGCRPPTVVQTAAPADDVADEESCDDSSIWISESSEGPPVLEADHPFLTVKDDMVREALDAFEEWRECPHDGADRQNPSTPVPTIREPPSLQGRKRVRLDPNEEGNEDDDQLSTKDSKQLYLGGRAVRRTLRLACPFYKKDRYKHLNCLKKFELKRIRDVKQHLGRKHRQPQYYCPSCWEVFDSATGRDPHVALRTCEPRDRPEFEGVSDVQKEKLSKRVDSAASEEQQWFSVWDILFDAPRPTSAYLGNEIEEVASMLRDYWRTEGQSFVSEFLRQRQMLPSWEHPNEERDLAALHTMMLGDMMDAMLDRFQEESSRAIGHAQLESVPTTPNNNEARPPLLTPAPSLRTQSATSSDPALSDFVPIPEAGPEAAVTEALPGTGMSINPQLTATNEGDHEQFSALSSFTYFDQTAFDGEQDVNQPFGGFEGGPFM